MIWHTIRSQWLRGHVLVSSTLVAAAAAVGRKPLRVCQPADVVVVVVVVVPVVAW